MSVVNCSLLYNYDDGGILVKKDIHPKYDVCKVTCACGNTFVTRSTKPEIRVSVCSKLSPLLHGQTWHIGDRSRTTGEIPKEIRWNGLRPDKRCRVMLKSG